jgi:predicted SnoaL-like aldol condensation-catalyzing enzyme
VRVVTEQQLEQNKKNVMAFYDLMFNQNNPAEAIKRYVGEVYIQHNPAVADGKKALLTILSGWQKGVQASVFTSSG